MFGCLLIHGFTGGPFEVFPLAEYLEKQGFRTLCPALAGHNGDIRNLKGVSYQDWIDSASLGYQELAQDCSRIAVIGFSMGGLIAIHLMERFKVEGLVFLSTPVYCLDFKNMLCNAVQIVCGRNKARCKELIRASHTPLRAVLEFNSLLRITKPKFQQICVPTLIMQGLKDDVVRWQSANFIYHNVAGKKSLVFYPDAAHRVCLGPEITDIREKVSDFVQSLVD